MGEVSILLLADTGTGSLAKCKKGLLQLVVGQAINEPSFRKELIGVREELGVPVVDHRSHANRSTSGDNEFGLAILALVDQFLFARDSCGSVRNTRHHAKRLMDDSPEVWLLLEVDPLEVRGVHIVQVFHQTSVDFGLSKEPVSDHGEDGLFWSVLAWGKGVEGLSNVQQWSRYLRARS